MDLAMSRHIGQEESLLTRQRPQAERGGKKASLTTTTREESSFSLCQSVGLQFDVITR